MRIKREREGGVTGDLGYRGIGGGMREWYERSLRWRAADELEEARADFWTNIKASINEAKRYE